jgi:hypothetical protein
VREFPEHWGTVKVADLSDVDEDGRLEQLDWLWLTDPPADGRCHHGSGGSTLPDAVVLTLGERPIARCDPVMLQIVNYLVWDAEYYFALRLREILDPERWATTPQAALAPPAVIYAEDKFHGINYQRGLDGEDDTMSFGGSWEDLEAEVGELLPLPAGQAPPISAMALLRAVERGDLAQVRSLLAAGVDPRGCTRAPEDLPALDHRHLRETNPPWAAAVGDVAPAILERLLEAGVRPDERPSEEHMTLLHGAISNGRAAQVQVLLRWGADPRARWRGRDAFELARGHEAIEALLRAHTSA